MSNLTLKSRGFFSLFIGLIFFLTILPFSEATAKEVVFVSIVPQKFFVEQIAGDLLEVQVLVGSGMSPHAYEPLPQQMAALARSRAFMTVGMPFERTLLEKIKSLFPDLPIIETDQGITRRKMASFEESGAHHQHHEGCTHGEGADDPHFWLDPQLVKIQAGNIAKALAEIFPEKKEVFSANLEKFSQQLDELTAELGKKLEPFKGRAIIVFHPAFGYFTDRFALVQRSIEIEGKEPAPRQIVQIIRQARAENVKVIFVQQQFSSRAAQTVADAISGKVVAIDPLAENYLQNLRTMGEKIVQGMQNE